MARKRGGRFGAAAYDDVSGLPDAAVRASLGCGNPVAVAAHGQVRRSWTWARAAASTCCYPPGGSAPVAGSTVWTPVRR